MIVDGKMLTAVLTAVSANFSNTQKWWKTQVRTHFLDLALKYQVVENQKIIGVCDVSTAVLTAVSADFWTYKKA